VSTNSSLFDLDLDSDLVVDLDERKKEGNPMLECDGSIHLQVEVQVQVQVQVD